MRVLGPAILDNAEQEALEAGRRTLLIRADRLFPDAAERARVGDILWAKEPFVDVKSPRLGCPEIHELIPGGSLGKLYDIPDFVRPWLHVCRLERMKASAMVRADSRWTMRITALEDSAFRVDVTKQNVNLYIGEVVKAA